MCIPKVRGRSVFVSYGGHSKNIKLVVLYISDTSDLILLLPLFIQYTTLHAY